MSLKTLQKGCFNKNRYDSLEQVSNKIIHGFNISREFLRHYKCPYCHGYHLTKKKANQKTLQQAKDFLLRIKV